MVCWTDVQKLFQAHPNYKKGSDFCLVIRVTSFPLDFPVIVSGKKLAYLEPQEKVWRGESGQWFDISDLRMQGPDGLAPFDNVCEFSANTTSDYRGTLFRFPLRDTRSELSENVYTVSKLHELLAALKKEAKFLLLFLRSIDTIEVFELTQYGEQQLFRVEIAERQQIYQDRNKFMDQLKSAHALQPYSISQPINVVTDFHVTVTDGGRTTHSHWLVANQVGSQTAAMKQHVFPWVGVALELNDGTASSPTSAGRIFCFLPMPAESSSPLPVHVNGTFGLNDDRRTLKWPGIERKNDPTAEWNTLLVNELLPPCYALLLGRAKALLAAEEYYSAWPEVRTVQFTNWSGLLLPLFRILMNQSVVWTDTAPGRWIVPSKGVFVPKEGQFSPVVHHVLSSCGVMLVDVPPRIWDAFQRVQFSPSCITPSLTRNNIRIHSSSYMSIDAHSKCELLRYCLTDQKYSDLQGLFLLPLADGKFEEFEAVGLYGARQHYYICSEDYPQTLLPNMSEHLVNVQEQESDLHSKLLDVASSKETQILKLDVQAVATLLPDNFPTEWRSCQTVSLPCAYDQWLKTFWTWVRSHKLSTFDGKLILPLVCFEQSACALQVTRLTRSSSVVSLNTQQCSRDLLQAFTKLQVRFTDPSQFPYLDHEQLSYYVNSLTSDGILTAIANAHPRIVEIQTTGFVQSEAYILQVYLSQQRSVSRLLRNALMFLPVLIALNQRLYPANEVTWNGEIVVEPEQFDLNHSCLPSNLIIMSREHNYIGFLNSMPGIEKPTKLEFILKFLFPMIRDNTFYPPNQIDNLMEQVLISMSYHSPELTSELRSLKFLKSSSLGTRKSPEELFDPLQEALKELYLGVPVFPIYPFDQFQYVLQLRKYGLRCSVTAQEIVQIIESIAGVSTVGIPQVVDQTRISRAKAVLSYLSSEKQTFFDCSVRMSDNYHSYPLKTALQLLALKYYWLPVQSLPPKHYPARLSWKGSTCTSHFTSLHGTVLFPCHDEHDELPTIAGSQVYVVDCSPSQNLSTIIASVCSTSLVKHVLAHFQYMINNHHKIDTDLVNDTVHMIYRYFHRNLSNPDLHGLHDYKWIWIKKHLTFVNSKMVVLKPHPSFRHDLEPYLYVLPDELSRYSTLFTKFRVTPSTTQSQIISVLKMIRDTDSSTLDVDETWSTIGSIFTWLTGYGKKCVELSWEDVLYVPIESAGPDLPQLVDASEVVYTDNDFLKTYLKSSETEESYTFVHDSITSQMAKCLGLTPFTERSDISEDTFEDVGQSEPLTQRLKNILRDYDGGLTIMKELIQNADDAGATVMNVCFDARTHDISPKNLFLAGMAECHGPALIVHNNRTFTDEDFQNIQKLAGATKQDKPLKIGKFGVGFCSVYHITDVPSFVSRDYLYIFDPTLKYIKQDVKDSTRTGKKVTFTKKLVASSKQLLPYEGLYEFDRKESYSGTMFRLPFRKVTSEISHVIYNERLVDQLINDIKKSSSKLLLFLRNVKQITFSQINPGDKAPRLILDIRKDVIEQIDTNTEAVCLYQNHTSTPALIQQEHWLVASHTRKIQFNNKRKESTAAVACLLQQKSLPYGYPTVYIPERVDGEVFCFLPLTLQTGLPVHVSSNFAVMNDRKGIKYSYDELFGSSSETQWNIKLMEQTIPEAYHNLLVALQQMCSVHKVQEETYNFLSLWPLQEKLKTQNPWDRLITPLYEIICSSASNLFYCTSLSRWQTLADSKILLRGILCHIANQDLPKCIFAVAEKLELPIVSLANSYRKHLPEAECVAITITEEMFIQLFFKNITSESLVDVRNEVFECLLQTFAVVSGRESRREEYLKRFMNENRCIPCTPTGMNLNLPTEVVDPRSSFASLYDPEDGVFPLEQLYANGLVHTALNQLGMITDSSSIPLSMLIERAESIQDQYSKDELKALERVQLILKCLLKYQRAELKPLAEIPFLPVKRKPNGYPLKWYGERYSLLSAKELVQGENNSILAGSQVPIICEELPKNGGCGYFPRRVINIRTCPTNQQVVKHFCHLIEVFEAQQPTLPGTCTPSMNIKFIEDTCLKVYKWLESQLLPVNPKLQCQPLKPDDPLFAELQCQPCVWNGKQFIFANVVARNWDHNGPYLFSLPSLLTTRPNLTSAIHIQEKFVTKDFLSALEKMYQEFRSVPINDKCQKVIPILLQALQEATDLPDNFTCYLPDTQFIMHDAKELAYNDAPWYEPEADWTFVNECVPRAAAEKLGVNMVRSKLLEKYEEISDDFGMEFGQNEPLTQRIKNILNEYPFDVTVLKELLQNADDAKATKMYVILDMRQHGTKSLPSDNWKDLQGPALLVWNDSVFSEADLRSIQRLGLGNKRADAESIGKYGIGFNVVYHLTDCPSFISNGTTLCVFDPHCRYDPGAKEQKPGRRYNKLDEKFWTHWPDLKAAYLQDKLLYCPKKGTLFRFPLRSTHELVKKSKLLDNHSLSMCLAGWKMKEYINAWAPDIKHSLLFLNHIVELKFFVIENKATPEVKTTHWFEVSLDNPETVTVRQNELHTKVAAFAEKGSESHVIMYSMTSLDKSTSSVEAEQWLIQKGVGDIDNQDQDWILAPRVKPIHGIATRLKPENDISFQGRLFCFLPLPVNLRLPVHVNGSFMLSSSRRNLWHSTNPNDPDDRMRWNLKLIEAIASSYAKLLVAAREFYIKSEGYDSKEVLKADIQRYYRVFPTWLCTFTPDNLYKDLAEMVYRKLDSQNAEVLMSIKGCHEPVVSADEPSISTVIIEWHPLCSPNPSQQSYFCSESEVPLSPILERIGMNLTAAPKELQQHFEDIEAVKLPEISKTTVYEYYSRFSEQVSTKGFPCHIEETVFLSVPDFQQFIQFLLQDSEEFSSTPFGLPLLLTADGQLRNFGKEHKVINSNFVVLFPQKQELFLHPEMQQINYDESYFLQPDDDNWSVVYSILSAALPLSLYTKRVQNIEQCISTEMLKSLWDCFLNDPIFNRHLKDAVTHWALLPSTSCQLFSFRPDRLMPLIDPTDSSSRECTLVSRTSASEDVFKLLKQAGMPILNTDIVPSPEANEIDQFCPALSNTVKVLSNLYYLHEEGRLQVFLDATPDIDDKIEMLFKYLGQIHFANVSYRDSLQKIKSLPLFRNIDGKLCTLLAISRVHIWPGDQVCLAGSDKWMKTSGCVFLKPSGMWRKLQVKASDLGIKSVSTLQVYTHYIFPHFRLLSGKERLEQLLHIREQLLDNAKIMSKLNSSAWEFINKLKRLPCIPYDGTLKPVSDFSDPEIKIFTTFQDSFLLLPKEWSSKEWLESFRKIGLQTKVSVEIFIKFCWDISKGDHEDLQEGSSVLLTYLFQAKEWHEKKEYLRKVSQIPFVCTETLPHLNSIKPIHSAENTHYNNGKAIHMTRLCGAVTLHEDHELLLWTLKPVVRLPELHRDSDINDFYSAIGVIQTPCTDDVIKNICNISQSRFSNFNLFDKYDEKYKMKLTSEERCPLLDVMLTNFTFLQERECAESQLKQLSGVPCVPVLAQEDITTAVLVQPQQVVSVPAADMKKLQPFLNPLPEQLYAVLPTVLTCIGVERNIGPAHIRFALENVHTTASGETLDPNTHEVVKHLLTELRNLLQSNSAISPEALEPLYLPNNERKLIQSTLLFYPDKGYHWKTRFNFSSSRYSLFSLLPEEQTHSEFTDIFQSLTEEKFCQKLPHAVSPRALSACTTNELHEDCSNSDVPLPLAEQLKSVLALPGLPKAMHLVFKNQPKADTECSKFPTLTALQQFFQSIAVITMKNVKVDILLSVDPERKKKIATTKMMFLLQKDNGSEEFFLYLSAELLKNVTLMGIDSFFNPLANEVMLHVSQMSGSDPKKLRSTTRLLSCLLKAETDDDISMILGQHFDAPAIAEFGSSTHSLTPKLGKCIPKSWHHRLDVNIHNIFRSEEWIGYGEVEETVYFARVGYRIPRDGQSSQLTDEYLIYTSDSDEEGTTVSVLDMYKFLRGPTGNQQSDADSNALCTFEGESEAVQLRQALDANDLVAIKRQICEDLKIIWKLPEEQKRKAIKRLYLKWHPDKNSNPLATKAFQYLQRQIERLNNGSSLEEPDAEETAAHSPPNWDSYWGSQIHRWNQTAKAHSKRCARENTVDGEFPFEAAPQPQPQPSIARVWLAQAESDLDALRVLLEKVDQIGRVCCHICFLAHEVAEKALKAGKYAVCGLDPGSLANHNLTPHAIALEQERSSTAGLRLLASSLESYYLDTRFPNRYSPPSTPSNYYNPDKAKTAAKTAEDIFQIIKLVVEES